MGSGGEAVLPNHVGFAWLGLFVNVGGFCSGCDWEGTIGIGWVEARAAIKCAVCSAQPLHLDITWPRMSAAPGPIDPACGRSQDPL